MHHVLSLFKVALGGAAGGLAILGTVEKFVGPVEYPLVHEIVMCCGALVMLLLVHLDERKAA